MALLFVDGFDHYATADITKKWTASSSATISASGGRRSSGAMSIGQDGYAYRSLSSTYSTIFVGFAMKPNAQNDKTFFALYEDGTEHICMTISAAGKIKVFRGNNAGTLLGTGTTTVSTGVFHHIEAKVVIADGTSGSVVVKLNGATELNLTSIDTRNGGTSGAANRVYLGDSALLGSGLNAVYDDLFVCDTSGSTNNDFLGDCRIDTLLPTGDGNYTEFTPSTGSTHYSLVDETTPNTTDYNASSTNGHRDSYTCPDLTALASQTIYGVQINVAALKDDAGARSLGTMSRLSSTNKDGAGVALTTGQLYISEIQETDPASSAWTESNVNAAEFGVKVTA